MLYSMDSVAKSVGLVVLAVVMISFSYLFVQAGEGIISAVLLVIGIVLTLVFVANTLMNRKPY